MHRNARYRAALDNRHCRCAGTAAARYRYRGRARVAIAASINHDVQHTVESPRLGIGMAQCNPQVGNARFKRNIERLTEVNCIGRSDYMLPVFLYLQGAGNFDFKDNLTTRGGL